MRSATRRRRRSETVDRRQNIEPGVRVNSHRVETRVTAAAAATVIVNTAVRKKTVRRMVNNAGSAKK